MVGRHEFDALGLIELEPVRRCWIVRVVRCHRRRLSTRAQQPKRFGRPTRQVILTLMQFSRVAGRHVDSRSQDSPGLTLRRASLETAPRQRKTLRSVEAQDGASLAFELRVTERLATPLVATHAHSDARGISDRDRSGRVGG
jgi:hypothetical protein